LKVRPHFSNKFLKKDRPTTRAVHSDQCNKLLCQLAFANEQVQFPLLAGLEPEGPVAKQHNVAGRQALFVVS
jgi:hypothetical protein